RARRWSGTTITIRFPAGVIATCTGATRTTLRLERPTRPRITGTRGVRATSTTAALITELARLLATMRRLHRRRALRTRLSPHRRPVQPMHRLRLARADARLRDTRRRAVQRTEPHHLNASRPALGGLKIRRLVTEEKFPGTAEHRQVRVRSCRPDSSTIRDMAERR